MNIRSLFPKTLITAVLTLLVTLPLASTSVGQIEKYVAGTHYTELRAPVNTPDDSKIEVLEAFWYGCSHCFRFEPLVADWESKAADDVDFRRFPAMWNALMKVHAQIYFTAEEAKEYGLIDRVLTSQKDLPAPPPSAAGLG